MLKNLWKYTEKTDKYKVVLYMIFHAVAMLGQLSQPIAFGMMINVLQRNDENMLRDVIKWLIFYIIGFAVFEIFHRTARFMERYSAFRTRKKFVTETYDHLNRLPLEWHSNNHSGDIIDRLNLAANSLHEFGESQYMFISVIMNVWVPMVVLWNLSPVITITAVIVGIILVIVTKAIYKKTVPEYDASNKEFHKVAVVLYDFIGNITSIIVLRLGKLAKRELIRRIDDVFPHIQREHRLTQVKCFINALLMILLNIGLILYYIIISTESGSAVALGSITILFSYLGSLMSTFDFYAGDFEKVIHWKADFEAIKEILNAVSFTRRNTENELVEWNDLQININKFTYNEGEFILRDISVHLEKGRKIAFVGESGAGKSTVLKLLRGIFEVDEQSVIKDGNQKLSIYDLESTTVLIPQEPEIFENTISYNITMGIEVDDSLIRKAIETACFNTVVERLPNKLESSIKEKGINLSGGEKQRLALARGVFSIGDSSLILFDEPTGSLDPITEMTIFKNVFEKFSDKCIVAALHRLHMVKQFDYIYVFKNGKIVEEGDFNELLDIQGYFKTMWDIYLNEKEIEIC